MELLFTFLKEYNIVGAIITGVIGAFAMVSSMQIFSKKIRAENKLMINNHSNRIDNDFLKFQLEVRDSLAEMNHILEKGFENFNARFEKLENKQEELQKKFEAKELLIESKFESLSQTVYQWLGNIDNVYNTIHEDILPNILVKTTKPNRKPRPKK
jgi:SMC interacting uncharacterized protein involved in chromosome segregation